MLRNSQTNQGRNFSQPKARLSVHLLYDILLEINMHFKVQRWTKRWTCFAKKQPGKARQKFLAT